MECQSAWSLVLLVTSRLSKSSLTLALSRSRRLRSLRCLGACPFTSLWADEMNELAKMKCPTEGRGRFTTSRVALLVIAAASCFAARAQDVPEGAYPGTMSCGPSALGGQDPSFVSPVTMTVSGRKVRWERPAAGTKEVMEGALGESGIEIEGFGGFVNPNSHQASFDWKTSVSLTRTEFGFSGPAQIRSKDGAMLVRECTVTLSQPGGQRNIQLAATPFPSTASAPTPPAVDPAPPSVTVAAASAPTAVLGLFGEQGAQGAQGAGSIPPAGPLPEQPSKPKTQSAEAAAQQAPEPASRPQLPSGRPGAAALPMASVPTPASQTASASVSLGVPSATPSQPRTVAASLEGYSGPAASTQAPPAEPPRAAAMKFQRPEDARPWPENPSHLANCNTGLLSKAQFQVCEDPQTSSAFLALNNALVPLLNRLYDVDQEAKKEIRVKALAAYADLWRNLDLRCPGLEYSCIEQATKLAASKADEVTSTAVAEAADARKAAQDRYYEQSDRAPLVVTNGGGGIKEAGNNRFLSSIFVENHSENAYSQIEVSCGLFVNWGDEKSIEPEFSYSIHAGIAPKSHTVSLPRMEVPWNPDSHADARIVKCRVLNTIAASASEAAAAVQKNQAETALIQQRTQMFLAQRDADRAEQAGDQVARLDRAMASIRPAPECRISLESMQAYRESVVAMQRSGQVRSAASIVDAAIVDARQRGCTN